MKEDAKMKFGIVPDNEGFMVVMFNSSGEPTVKVAGFATHEAAQAFIQDILIKMLASIQARMKAS